MFPTHQDEPNEEIMVSSFATIKIQPRCIPFAGFQGGNYPRTIDQEASDESEGFPKFQGDIPV